MRKPKSTRINVVIVFEQHGKLKSYLYHGEFKDAKISLNFSMAIPYSKMVKMGRYESVGCFNPGTSEVLDYKECPFGFIKTWYDPTKRELTEFTTLIIKNTCFA